MVNGWRKKGWQGQCLISFPFALPFKQSEHCHFFRQILPFPTFHIQPLIIKRQFCLLLSYGNPQWDKWAFFHLRDGLGFGPVPSDFSRNCEARVGQSKSLGPCQPSFKHWTPSQISSSWWLREASEFKASGFVPGDSDSRLFLHWILWGYKRQPGSKSGTWVSLLIIPCPCKSHSWLKYHFISFCQWIKLDLLWFILVCRVTKGREWKCRVGFFF